MGRLCNSKVFLWLALIPAIAVACASCDLVVPVSVPTLMPPPTAISAAISTPIPAPTPVVTATPDGQPGGTHRDVHQERQETLSTLGQGLAYSRLLRLRTGPLIEQPSILLECDLCQSWELTSGFAYEFQLHPGVQWQNQEPVNGRELVASDLEYSYQRMQTPGWANATMFSQQGIAGFEALDDHRLRVNLDFLDSDALLSLADGHSKIVTREVIERYGDLKDSPVIGRGPVSGRIPSKVWALH